MSNATRDRKARLAEIEGGHGRSISEWTQMIRSCGLTDGETVRWLKAEHGLDHEQARALIEQTHEEDRARAGVS